MANKKLSQIPASVNPAAIGDTVVGVTSGPTDVRFSLTQLTRQKLTGNANYYVAKTGSDSNPGTISQPWFSPQHAIDFLSQNIDGAGFNVYVNFANGTYPGPNITALVPNAFVTVFVGNITDRTKVIFDDTGQAGAFSGCCLEFQPDNVSTFQVTSINFKPTGTVSFNGDGVENDCVGSTLSLVDCQFTGPPAGGMAWGLVLFTSFGYNVLGVDYGNVFGGGALSGQGTTTVTGTWQYWLFQDQFQCVLQCFGSFNSLNTPAFANAFAFVGAGFCIFEFRHLQAITGSATGKRFELQNNCGISTFTNDLNHLPGNAAGTFLPGSWYDNYNTAGGFSGLVSALPNPTAFGAGSAAFVTDSTVSLSAGLGNVVVGGGGNATPVYSDGTNWRIG